MKTWTKRTKHSPSGGPAAIPGWFQALLLLSLATCLTAKGIVVYEEDWDSSDCGWQHRTSGEMNVCFSATNSPDEGALIGVFPALDCPSPDADVFNADAWASGGMFVGDYWSSGQSPYCLSFDFYAQDVLPSCLHFRFRSSSGVGTNGFFMCLDDQLTTVGTWQRIQVPFQFSSNRWFGGSAADFSNALSNVEWAEVQVLRNGTGSQTYVIDHFSRVDWPPIGSETNDVDHDGMPDYWEEAYYRGATNGLPDQDDDRDGFSNREEYEAGTHPLAAFSYPLIEAIEQSGRVDVRFPSAVGREYQIEKTTDVLEGLWIPLLNATSGNGDDMSVTDTNISRCGIYRFRVRVFP